MRLSVFEMVEAALAADGVPAEFVLPVALVAEQLEVWRAARSSGPVSDALVAALVGDLLVAVGVDVEVASPGDLLLLAEVVRPVAARPVPGRHRGGLVA